MDNGELRTLNSSEDDAPVDRKLTSHKRTEGPSKRNLDTGLTPADREASGMSDSTRHSLGSINSVQAGL